MTRVALLARRELGATLGSPFGWVIVALVLALDGALFNGLAMAGQRPTSEVVYQLFYFSAGVTMVASVLVTMRTFAAEREHGTLVLLTTSPASAWEIVLGKFLGAWALLALLVLLTFYLPLIVAVNGDVSWGQVASGYLGLLLLGGATTALGVFASALSRSQLLAAVLAAALIAFFLTTWYLAKATDPPLRSALSYLALFDKHYRPFIEGAVHLRGVVYLASLTFIGLLASVRVLESRTQAPLSALARPVPAALLGGLVLIFIGERAIGGPSALRWTLSALGLIAVLGAAAQRFSARRRLAGPARHAADLALTGHLAVIAALAAYLLTTRAVGLAGEGARWPAAVTALWVITLTCGLAVTLAADHARSAWRHPERVDLRRVRAAAAAALGFTLALSWVAVANHLADAHDVRADWSHAFTARAGADTHELVANLPADVEIVLFYPPGSGTLERIAPYFDDLAAHSDRLTVTTLDHAVEPARAGVLGVSGNGHVAVVRGAEVHRIGLAADYRQAKRRLRGLDREVQEAILKVSYERRTMSFTRAHGERTRSPGADGRAGLERFSAWFKTLNVGERDLGVREGLGREIDPAAGVVAVVGPTDPFLPEEIASLIAWYDGGGSLLLLLDPGADHALAPLLTHLGLALADGVVCHDRDHLRVDGGPADRAIIRSNRFGAHPVARTLANHAAEAWVVLDGAGALRVVEGAPRPVGTLVNPVSGSWRDLDGDRQRDPEEAGPVGLLAAATSTGDDADAGRAVVIADSDLVADGRLNRANLQLITDAVAWLARAGDAQLRVTRPADDPPLIHTRDEDAFWFWLTIAAVPLAVLAAGLWWVRRRRRPRLGGSP